MIKRIEDAKQNLAPIMNDKINESPIPLQVLYNEKVERIRMLEHDMRIAPASIKFDISDGFTGVTSNKRI